MTHKHAKQSSWMAILLFCFTLQALVPAGYMLGTGSDGFITLCTTDGLSSQLLSSFGEVETSHSTDSLCPQSISAEPLLPGKAISAEPGLTHRFLNTQIIFSETGKLATAYLSRAPPSLLS